MKNSQVIRTAAQYGAVLGGIFVAIGLVVYVFEINMFDFVFSSLLGLVNIALIVVLMVQAVKIIRDRFFEGTIPFLDTFLLMLLVGIVGSLISIAFNYLLNGFFDPDYQLKSLPAFEQNLIDQGVPAEMIKEIMLKMRASMVPEKQLITGLIYSSIMNSVLAVITALIFRKKPKVEDLIK